MPKSKKNKTKVGYFLSESQRKHTDRISFYFGSKRVMVIAVLLVAVSIATGLGIAQKSRDSRAATVLTPLPTQPAGFFYNSEPSSAWAKPGALVVCGRDNCGGQGFKNVSAAGGTVLVYIDTIVNVSAGKYHSLYMNNSSCGGAVGLWPGGGQFNSWGKVNDVRVGSTAQQKLECVLNQIVADNPHIGGFFADDLGGDNGHTQAGLPKDEYYNAAVALSKTFRKVADRYNLMFVPNGGWEGGSHNAGYPNRSTPGNALADGVCVEHHSAGELSYWTTYLKNGQWAQQSPLTNGNPFHIIITYPGNDFNAYNNAQFKGFIANQSDYANAGSPWGSFHATGLPYKVNGSTGTAPSPAPTPPAPSPTPPQPSPTIGTKPSIPKNVKLTPSNNSLVVTWDAAPSGDKVDTYQVYLNDSFTYTTVTSPTYTISGVAGTTYKVRVSAHNSVGFGDWTESYSGVIGGSAPVVTNPTAPTTPAEPTTSQSPYDGIVTIPGKLNAQNFDNGGEGVSYHDTDTSNNGNKYRSTAVDLEDNKEGGYNVGWVAPGEWLEYTSKIAQTGTYDATFRVATSGSSTGNWTLKDGNKVLASVSTSDTGGWYSWKDIVVRNISLSATSNKILRLEASGQPLNISSIKFVKQATTTQTPDTTSSPSTTNTSIIVEAEKATSCNLVWTSNSSCSFGLRSLSGSGASNNSFVNLISQGSNIYQKFSVTSSGNYRLGFVMKGTDYRGQSKVDVYIDNIKVSSGYELTNEFGYKYLDKYLTAGQHDTKVVFINDKCGNSWFPKERCDGNHDRNVWVDQFRLNKY